MLGGLEPGASCTALLFNPATGEEIALNEATTDADGKWTLCQLANPDKYSDGFRFSIPFFQDWLLVLEAK